MMRQGHSQRSQKRPQSSYFLLCKSRGLGGSSTTTRVEGKEACILLFALIATQNPDLRPSRLWMRPFLPSCLNSRLILACSSQQNYINRCNRSQSGMAKIWNIPTNASVLGAKICRTSTTRIFGVYSNHTALREKLPSWKIKMIASLQSISNYLPVSLLSRKISHNRCRMHHPRWFTFGYGIENIWNISERWSYIVKGTYKNQTTCDSSVSGKGSQKSLTKGGHHSMGFVTKKKRMKTRVFGWNQTWFESTQEVECRSGC